jgi:hypothetical protein
MLLRQEEATMYAYPRALLIVLTMAGMPAAEAACVLKEGSAAAEAAIADRCTAPEPADGRLPARQRDEIMQWIAERLDLPQAEDRPAIVSDAPDDPELMRNGALGNRRAPTPP